MITIQAQLGVDTERRGSFELYRRPDECPICHRAVNPNQCATAIAKEGKESLEICFQCTRQTCAHLFIGRYKTQPTSTTQFYLQTAVPITGVEPEIPKEVVGISQSFEKIYGQAFMAESYELDEIAGGGYRKALEFLIKDYCIKRSPDKTEIIKKDLLGACIKKHVDDNNIKICAERAAWLGNDETHYTRK